jgi:hypothetical protein
MQTSLKQILVVTLASVAMLGACKKGNDAEGKMKEFKTQMCACADKKDGAADCAKKVTDDMTKWGQDNAGKADTSAKPSDEMTETTKKFTECATKAMMAGMPSAPTMGGSGSAAGGDTMAGGGSGATMAGGGSGATMAGGGIASKDDYTKKNEEIVAKFGDVIKAGDCDKGAAALTSLIDGNLDTLKQIHVYETAHPDDDKAFDAAHKDAEKPITDYVTKCEKNAAFTAAMAKMPQ